MNTDIYVCQRGRCRRNTETIGFRCEKHVRTPSTCAKWKKGSSRRNTQWRKFLLEKIARTSIGTKKSTAIINYCPPRISIDWTWTRSTWTFWNSGEIVKTHSMDCSLHSVSTSSAHKERTTKYSKKISCLAYFPHSHKLDFLLTLSKQICKIKETRWILCRKSIKAPCTSAVDATMKP
jgi:hypothetical protein